ncbi:MAG: hypothetical protein M1308_03190 [Actinobacteria bacterium]|nr:hypothetical protein [Actinomycetota bacterium]MCL5069886.1 hypothetical protein [Actinomycetota bacterium]
MKKNYNKYTIFTDRFPFIIFALIIIFAVIFVFQFKAKYPLPFFSASESVVQDTASTSYSIFVASPNDAEVFNFINKN